MLSYRSSCGKFALTRNPTKCLDFLLYEKFPVSDSVLQMENTRRPSATITKGLFDLVQPLGLTRQAFWDSAVILALIEL